MKKFFIILSAITFAIVSCNKEPDASTDNKDLSITATIAATKTSVSSSALEWVAGDNITVALDGESYIFKTTEQGTTAKFTPEDGLTQSQVAGSPLAAYYGCDAFGSFTIPQIQTVTNGVSRTGVPMYAYTMESPEDASLAMTFTPVASVIEFTFAPFDIRIDKIEISPVDDSSVNGSFSGAFAVNPVTGKVTSKSAIHSATVVFADGLNISKGGSFLFPIGWFSTEGGIKVTVTYNNEADSFEDVIFADAPFQSFAGSGDKRSYKFIHQDMELSIGPRDWYVKADGKASDKGRSWNDATTLDSALANADAGSTIHIAAGEYKPGKFPRGYEDDLAAMKTFEVSRSLSLIGDGSVVLNGADVYHTMIVTTRDKVSIEGITIKGGAAGGDAKFLSAVNDSTYNSSYAGGLYAVASDLSLKNVNIEGNTATTAAGAYIYASKVSLNNVTVSGNVASMNGGGLMLESSDGEIDGLKVSGNTSVGGITAGLYIYAAAGRESTIAVRNSVISQNNAQKGNVGGLDVRGGNTTSKVNVTVENCEISKNYSEAQAGGFRVINSTVAFKSCKIVDNEAKTNGANLVYEASDVTLENCLFSGNKAGLAAAIYQYTSTGSNTLKVIGSEFSGNTTAGRGGAIYARSAHKDGSHLSVINSTFSSNTAGSTGSAIAFYGATATPVDARIVSSTITGNTCSRTSATPGGAIGIETVGISVNVCNTIVSGNIWAAAPESADIFVGKAESTCSVSSSVVGATVLDESGKAVAGASFDAAAMLKSHSDASHVTSVYQLVGAGNPALTAGASAAALKTFCNGIFADAVISVDQWGNARNGNVMGAYVAK